MFTIDIMVDPKCDADLHIMRTNHQTGTETTVTALYADGTLVFFISNGLTLSSLR